MSADSQWPLQTAVYSKLTADIVVQGLLGNPARIFDHVPQASPFPYAVIGETTAQVFDTKTEAGLEQRFLVHTWSRYRGLKETKEIMAAIAGALDQAALSIGGHTLVLLRFEFATTTVDPDGFTRHGVQRFRALTQAAP